MMRLSEIASVLHAPMIGDDVEVLSVGTDSRHIEAGQLFVALSGEHFDGNAFAQQAISQGAAAALVSRNEDQAAPVVMVKNTRFSLGELAQYWRNRFDLPLIAVTGSNGKTTVKEMIASILSAGGGHVLATQGNLNNDIGMPLTLLKIRAEHSAAVIEMGMNHEGEIRYLSKIAKPNIAVINNAGTAHIGELGSREAIAQAKGEIFEGLAMDGIAIINADNPFADYWKSLNTQRRVLTFGLKTEADISATYVMANQRMQVTAKTPNGLLEFSLSVLGEHNVSNALAAAAAAVALNVPLAKISQGLNKFSAVKGRLNMVKGLHGAMVIDDTYNANPDSMKAAIDVLINEKLTANKQLIFVMGDMAELGDNATDLHAEIGAYAKQAGINRLFTLGDLSQAAAVAFNEGATHFSTLESLIETLGYSMKPDVTVLVKGSRSAKMERVVQAIVEINPVEIDKLAEAH